MLNIILDALIALLAAVGISAIIWVVLDILLDKSLKKNMFMCTVVVAGKSGDLRNTIRTYIRRNSAPTDKQRLFIADFGMSDKDKKYAWLMEQKYKNVLLINAEDLYYYIASSFAENK